MTLLAASTPEAVNVAGEIMALAQKKKRQLDCFFWLKARRNPTDGEALFNTDNKASERFAKPSDEQYRVANIVLQGGGVLGLAHAGFVAGMELANVRFAGLAGTSAGAITALGMAAIRGTDLLTPTHGKLLEIVRSMPMDQFIDGSYRTRWLIKQLLLNKNTRSPKYWLAWFGMASRVLRLRGLNPGQEFENWLALELAQLGISTIRDMNDASQRIAKVLQNAGVIDMKVSDSTGSTKVPTANLLKLMAASVPVGIKFEFPRNMEVLAEELMDSSPAIMARASMSIPIFFEPTSMRVQKNSWPGFISGKMKGYTAEKKLEEFKDLEEVYFLDGGIFSNLPVDAFRQEMPSVPTIAVPLISSSNAKPVKKKASAKSLMEDVFSTAFMVRNQRDHDAIERLKYERENFTTSPQTGPKTAGPQIFPHHLASIDTGDVNWLNFSMTGAEMNDLFVTGLKRARLFLEDDIDRIGETK